MQNKHCTPFSARKIGAQEKNGLHERNLHRNRYDFQQLIKASPDLAPFILPNRFGAESIDFSNPTAVKSLNRALLKCYYGLSYWDIPENYLCPSIPGRADYIHHIADLLSASHNGVIPRGAGIRALDIGVGANCVYPIIGQSEYGWSFLGVDIDPVAIASANKIIHDNSSLIDAVQLRLQPSANHIFAGILHADEFFDIAICNPPFHASPEEALQGTQRKWKNLGKVVSVQRSPNERAVLNFGGQNNELWCDGGEAAFIGRMIEQSAHISHQCLWFSTLVSKESNLAGIHRLLKKSGAADVKTINMTQGQKKSRIVAWSFFDQRQRTPASPSRFNPR